MAVSNEAAETSFLVPTVTPDDLLQFHLDHFGRTPTDVSLNLTSTHETQHEAEFEEFDNLDLGYYPDGVPRTLTDEQIAIFRHSEIQRLLLKQERDAEAAAELEEFDDPSVSGSNVPGNVTSTSNVPEKSASKVSRKRRNQFASTSEKSRNQARLKQHQETEDWRVSTRRRVRELDDVSQQGDVVLDY